MIQLSELIGHDAIDVGTATTTRKVTGIGLVANRIASVGISDECVDAAASRGFDGEHGGPQYVPVDPRGSRVLGTYAAIVRIETP